MIQRNNFSGIFQWNQANKANRPTERPEMAAFDWLLEAISLVGLMVFAGFLIYNFPRLPDTIPTHFNAAGIADDYDSKSTIWLLPGMAILIYAVITLFSLVPHQFNFSVKITPANALRQYALAIRLMRYIKAALIWMFFYICYATFRVAVYNAPGLGLGFLPVVLAGMILPLIIYFIVAYRKR